jgi:hypothetical protein
MTNPADRFVQNLASMGNSNPWGYSTALKGGLSSNDIGSFMVGPIVLDFSTIPHTADMVAIDEFLAYMELLPLMPGDIVLGIWAVVIAQSFKGACTIRLYGDRIGQSKTIQVYHPSQSLVIGDADVLPITRLDDGLFCFRKDNVVRLAVDQPGDPRYTEGDYLLLWYEFLRNDVYQDESVYRTPVGLIDNQFLTGHPHSRDFDCTLWPWIETVHQNQTGYGTPSAGNPTGTLHIIVPWEFKHSDMGPI